MKDNGKDNKDRSFLQILEGGKEDAGKSSGPKSQNGNAGLSSGSSASRQPFAGKAGILSHNDKITVLWRHMTASVRVVDPCVEPGFVGANVSARSGRSVFSVDPRKASLILSIEILSPLGRQWQTEFIPSPAMLEEHDVEIFESHHHRAAAVNAAVRAMSRSEAMEYSLPRIYASYLEFLDISKSLSSGRKVSFSLAKMNAEKVLGARETSLVARLLQLGGQRYFYRAVEATGLWDVFTTDGMDQILQASAAVMESSRAGTVEALASNPLIQMHPDGRSLAAAMEVNHLPIFTPWYPIHVFSDDWFAMFERGSAFKLPPEGFNVVRDVDQDGVMLDRCELDTSWMFDGALGEIDISDVEAYISVRDHLSLATNPSRIDEGFGTVLENHFRASYGIGDTPWEMWGSDSPESTFGYPLEVLSATCARLLENDYNKSIKKAQAKVHETQERKVKRTLKASDEAKQRWGVRSLEATAEQKEDPGLPSVG